MTYFLLLTGISTLTRSINSDGDIVQNTTHIYNHTHNVQAVLISNCYHNRIFCAKNVHYIQ